mgnify:CR=1 FL=1
MTFLPTSTVCNGKEFLSRAFGMFPMSPSYQCDGSEDVQKSKPSDATEWSCGILHREPTASQGAVTESLSHDVASSFVWEWEVVFT